MGSTMVFLPIRVLHVLLAATWLGATVFTTFLLMPVVESMGAAGGQVMIGLNKRGLTAFFASMGGLTVLTGIYLYWRFTGGFDPAISRSNAGMAFGIGGVAGLLATIFGGAIVGDPAGGQRPEGQDDDVGNGRPAAPGRGHRAHGAGALHLGR